MKRLITETDQAFERMLLRSARLDVAPENGACEAMQALAGAAARLPTSEVGPTPLQAEQLIAARLGTLGAWKWLGAGVVLGGFAGAGAMAIHRPPPSPSIAATVAVDAPVAAPVVRAPAESFREPSAAPPAAAISSPAAITPLAPRFRAPTVAATSTSNVAEAPSQAVTSDGISTLTAEAAAIDRARRALASGSPGQAIELLDRYERESPTHALAPDAQALRIQAEKARGNDVLAKKLAEKFLSLYPSDPHAERVRRVLLGQ